jgi:hypothetical protein
MIDPGLCAECVHALLRPTRRDTVYLRCARAAVDDRLPKYPQLPVVDCFAYEHRDQGES